MLGTEISVHVALQRVLKKRGNAQGSQTAVPSAADASGRCAGNRHVAIIMEQYPYCRSSSQKEESVNEKEQPEDARPHVRCTHF